MKKLLTAILFLGFMIGATLTADIAQAQNEPGDISIGGGLAFGEGYEELGLKVDGIYRINDDFRAGADIIYFFTGDGLTAWELNLNGNYVFTDDGEFMAYALSGINYARQSFDMGQFGSFSNSEIGLNIGAGLEYDVDFARLTAEVKYALSSLDQLVISAGLRFPIN